ncbi:hypothetical protein AB0911_37530, partial [Streptomyces nigra]|uniref:hypothetical protein n=1 Tax=Streptomyces nigra TaxID=1827580 RepID=UPI003454CA4E
RPTGGAQRKKGRPPWPETQQAHDSPLNAAPGKMNWACGRHPCVRPWRPHGWWMLMNAGQDRWVATEA